jgi:bacterioferritin
MSRPTPLAISWLKRALRHEFGAVHQALLQSAVAERLGDSDLAEERATQAAEELHHARRFAVALAATGAGIDDGPPPGLPIGQTVPEILQAALATEERAVKLYREAARACAPAAPLGVLFTEIGGEELAHLEELTRRLGRYSAFRHGTTRGPSRPIPTRS